MRSALRGCTDGPPLWTLTPACAQDDINRGESAVSIVKKDKMNYTMHKNDIVVCCSKGWFNGTTTFQNKAYPNVISTYASMSEAAQYWLKRLYHNTKDSTTMRACLNVPISHRGTGDIKEEPLKPHEQQQIDTMPQFSIMGVSLGLAYAHPDSGDTVGTVMYGGLRTVMNGPIKANTGQPVMWIFEFEAALFDTEGRRYNITLPDVIEDGNAQIQGQVHGAYRSLDTKTLDRKRWHDRENANFPGMAGKKNIFFIIPYVRNDYGGENMLDRSRVFGTYISSAREFEMVDIKLQNQAV